MIRQLKWRFVAILMSVVSSVVFFSLLGNYLSAKIQLEEETTEILTTIAQGDRLDFSHQWNTSQVFIPYFSIEMYHTGQVFAIWDEYYQLTESDLLLVATAVVMDSSTQGTLSEYNLRYVCQETLTGFKIVCSDLSFETSILQRFFHNSLFFGGVALLFLFFLSLLLSKLLLKPIEDAWAQQQQFVADASHELKTPLTVMIASAEMLSEHLASEHKSTRWLENITTEGNRMHRLLEDMLCLMQQPEEKETVDFHLLVENAVMMFEPIAFEKNVALMDNLDETSDCNLRGNKDRLQQLLFILLDNAVKYSIPPNKIHIELKKQQKYLLLSVKNNSQPISPEQCQQIFHRFYRQDLSRSTQKGYGLGLPIAKNIVHAHSGKITASYKEGICTLTVRLPLIS